MARTKQKPVGKGKGPMKTKSGAASKPAEAKTSKNLVITKPETVKGPKTFKRDAEGKLLRADGSVFKKRRSGRCMKSKRMIRKLQKSTHSITARVGVRRAITACIGEVQSIQTNTVRCTPGSVDSMRMLTEATFILLMRKAVDLLVFRGGRILKPKDVVCALMQMKFGNAVLDGIRQSEIGGAYPRLRSILKAGHLE